ncbi:MAG: hypothetical protein NT113_11765 [Hyphomicrobiales bacterium]|nr:hypothetical protein [Hyphomicrobiales bacterium]
MTVRYLTLAAVGLALLTGGAMAANGSAASTYKASEFFTLDLQKALLSPKPIGPGARFEPYPIEARADAKNALDAAADEAVAERAVPAAKPTRKAVAKRSQPPARSRVARPRSNPLDANAADTRIQTWPCRSGGICNWQR